MDVALATCCKRESGPPGRNLLQHERPAVEERAAGDTQKGGETGVSVA